MSGVSASVDAVAFDPDVEVENHHIEMRAFGRIAEVLEAIPEPLFVWNYPLYVLQADADKYAAFRGKSGRGDLRLGVAVFTDEDLAQRYNEVRKASDKVLPVDDALAFSRFLRKQHAPFVSFDPSKVAKGMASRFTIPVPSLLEQLPKPT